MAGTLVLPVDAKECGHATIKELATYLAGHSDTAAIYPRQSSLCRVDYAIDSGSA